MIHLVFDTETTGIPLHRKAKPETQPRILEWAGVLVDEKGDVKDQLDILIDPVVVCSRPTGKLLDWKGITRITGLTEEDLKCKPTFPECVEQIRPFFKAADVLIAHNLPFDRNMMELDLARCEITDWPWPSKNICTVQEHAEEWGFFPKLIHLYEHYTGKPYMQTHRALDDVMALVEVCKHAGILK